MRLITIEGCVGAGKSTLAKHLALHRNGVPLLEMFELNPFLRDFYNDPRRNAFETECAFLLIHFHQLKVQADKNENCDVIADFHIAKDLLYASLNISDQKAISTLKSLHDHLEFQLPMSQIMICLSI